MFTATTSHNSAIAININIRPHILLSQSSLEPWPSQPDSLVPPTVYAICQVVSLIKNPNVNHTHCGHSGALKLMNLGKKAAKNKMALGLDRDTHMPCRKRCVALLTIWPLAWAWVRLWGTWDSASLLNWTVSSARPDKLDTAPQLLSSQSVTKAVCG